MKTEKTTGVKLIPYGKESNPEALISKSVKTFSGSEVQAGKIDLFAPRGDNAKDAFDRELFDMLEEKLNPNYDDLD